MEEEFGDFEEVSEEEGQQVQPGMEAPVRVKLPREGQIIGKVMQRLGGNRMDVKCTDGKNRNCRVPGRFKRTMWLRINDIVLVEPWPDDNNKADVIFHYKSQGMLNQLRKRGFLDNLKDEF
jgi:translation initiation factor 1A